MLSCVAIPDRAFDQASYLSGTRHDASIYTGADGAAERSQYLSVFSLEPHGNVRGVIDSLLLVEFRDHPTYYMLEMQGVLDGGHRGAIALLYHHENSSVDIYATSGLHLDEAGYASLLNQNITIAEVPLDAVLEYGPNGFTGSLNMVDRYGELIRLRIEEQLPPVRRGPRGILAPIAAGSETPDRFSLIYLAGFQLIPIRNTIINLQIGGRTLQIDRIPALVDGRRVYNAKYSFDNTMIDFNVDRSESVTELLISPGNDLRVSRDGVIHHFAVNGDRPELSLMATSFGDSPTQLHFSPPFPDIGAMGPGTEASGRFAFQIGPHEGVIGGQYLVTRDDTSSHVHLELERGWQPMPGPLWIGGYRWNAIIDWTVDPPSFSSAWRNER